MAWIKRGSTTLESTGNDLDITSFTASDSNQFLVHTSNTQTVSMRMTFNNTSATSEYARRTKHDDGSDGSNSDDGYFDIGYDNERDKFWVHYWCDTNSQKKYGIANSCSANGTAQTQINRRSEQAMIYKNSSARITRVDHNNNLSGSWNVGTNFSILGSGGTEELNVQDGAIYYETDTNKEFLLYNDVWTEL